MSDYKYISVDGKNEISTLWLSRPSVHNALNNEMIREILSFLRELKHGNPSRILVIRGRGESFCSGADLMELKQSVELDFSANLNFSLQLADLYEEICNCESTTICVLQGASYGGANGIVAASDYAFADTNTIFSFSEVKLGLVPATIMPYVINKLGSNKSLYLMQTGRQFSAGEAKNYGLINEMYSETEREQKLTEFIEKLLEGGPAAQKTIKNMIKKLAPLQIDESIKNFTAEHLAKAKISDEGQEGMAAFFEKRNPAWKK
ncbi:MAG: enoyl-CoA hydratase/isomerase family protein [Bacteroidales bacterium]|nr:enoyl-CoA hydratase/isomerase family protein [Bacteroidales bacterium]